MIFNKKTGVDLMKSHFLHSEDNLEIFVVKNINESGIGRITSDVSVYEGQIS